MLGPANAMTIKKPPSGSSIEISFAWRRRLSKLKVVVSTFQEPVCRALNASAGSIQECA